MTSGVFAGAVDGEARVVFGGFEGDGTERASETAKGHRLSAGGARPYRLPGGTVSLPVFGSFNLTLNTIIFLLLW